MSSNVNEVNPSDQNEVKNYESLVRERLSERQIKELRDSGLNFETIEKAKFFRISVEDAVEHTVVQNSLGWTRDIPKEMGEWLGIPFFGIDGNRLPDKFCRWKPEFPREEVKSNGKKKYTKYEQPLGKKNHVFFPITQSHKLYGQSDHPLIITEGEKKALALVQHGFNAIGITGIYAWVKPGSRPKDMIEDLSQINFKGRKVFILFDSDINENKQIKKAAYELSEALKRAGAFPRCAILKSGPNGTKAGADDVLLLENGNSIIEKAIEDSVYLENPSKIRFTDEGNAKRLIQKYGDNIRYVIDTDAWYVYSGGIWVEDKKLVLISALFKDVIADLLIAANGDFVEEKKKIDVLKKLIENKNSSAEIKKQYEEEVKAINEDIRTIEREIKSLERCEDEVNVKNAIKSARTHECIQVKEFDTCFNSNDWLFNCPNGTYNIATSEFKEHDPKDLITLMSNTNFNPDAKCQKYNIALKKLFKNNLDMIDYIKSIIGTFACGDTTRQKAYFVLGEGSNGKSTLFDLLLDIFGPYGKQIHGSVLIVEKSGNKHPTCVMDLKGVRLAIASENNHGDILDTATLKLATGGDRMSGRMMHQNFETFKMKAKIVSLTNHFPKVTRKDYGFERRVEALRFAEKFWKDEDVKLRPNDTFDPDMKADASLFEAIKNEEKEGVLFEILTKATEYYANGKTITVPKCVEEETVNCLKQCDQRDDDGLDLYFAKYTIKESKLLSNDDKSVRVSPNDFYNHYCAFATAHGIKKSATEAKFYKDASKYFDKGKSNGLMQYFVTLVAIENKSSDFSSSDNDIQGGREGGRYFDKSKNNFEKANGIHLSSKNKNGISEHPPCIPASLAINDFLSLEIGITNNKP